jgi:type IV secretory pathway VirB2 component (pilin)
MMQISGTSLPADLPALETRLALPDGPHHLAQAKRQLHATSSCGLRAATENWFSTATDKALEMSLLTFAQNLAQFITGPFGVSLITLAIAGTAMAAAVHAMRWSHVFTVVFMGAIAFSAAWIVQTFLNA